MTKTDVISKIDSISFYQNRYIHTGAFNLCEAILREKHFSKNIKLKVQKIKTELEGLSEPWGYWENNSYPNQNTLNSVQDCLNALYRLME
ncbi:hypothetical protein [uncultured Flavobacterium sp.]|uniref:hypothetical protein n=1 Tax=uncultured Flavobacterium sp. TaxID=165435 RepID=UPI0030EBC63B|tara:strand:+ start:11057 stop:11326 length:270 start_codon:yes stop_codon:yes gene_type:complete